MYIDYLSTVHFKCTADVRTLCTSIQEVYDPCHVCVGSGNILMKNTTKNKKMKKYDRPRWSDYKFPIAEADIVFISVFR